MSTSPRSKREAKLCKKCGEHPALYRSQARGRLRWARDHDLCQRCWRSLKDSQDSEAVAPRRLSLIPRSLRRRGTQVWQGLKTGTEE